MRFHGSVLLVMVLCIFPHPAYGKIKIGATVLTDSNTHYFTYARHLRVPTENQNGPIWEAGNDLEGKSPEEIAQLRTQTETLTTASLRELYDCMYAATRTFTFSGISTAQEEFTLRRETLDKLHEMNETQFFWYDNEKPDADYWIYESERQGRSMVQTDYLRQKLNTAAHEAIEEICDNPEAEFRGECFGAIVICIWWGQYQALEAERFDQKWPATTVTNVMSVGNVLHNRGGARAKLLTRETNLTDQGVPGDWFYMRNYNYDAVRRRFEGSRWLPDGDYYYQGENALFVGYPGGQKKFEGLGAGPSTEQELRTQLRDAYNEAFSDLIEWNESNPPSRQLRVNGEAVRRLVDNATDNAKIFWCAYDRIHN